MLAHLRANLLVAGLTLLICSLLYPLALLGVGRVPGFREQAEGSIVRRDGKPVGSSLVAQEFKGDKWFQPRPSAASWKGDASSPSNSASNNPVLRDRVAQQLGPIVKYVDGLKKGQSAADDVVAWFSKGDRRLEWATTYQTLAGNWVKSDDLIKAFVQKWIEDHPNVMVEWKKDNPDLEYDSKKPDTAVVQFFKSYCAAEKESWPAILERPKPDGTTDKQVVSICSCASDPLEIKAYSDAVVPIFFDFWLQKNSEDARHLEQLPADRVTTSGSGLDPDITERNAQSQIDRVVAAWSTDQPDALAKPEARVRAEVEAAVHRNAYRPLGGLVGGEPLVNVLALNIDLEQRLRMVPNKLPKAP
jgi:K+-transporting ATPase ATPase C chain